MAHSIPMTATKPADTAHTSWLALVVVVLAQVQMAFNITALPVSVGPITEDLNIPPTSVATSLVVYSLFVAAFVLVGAKLGDLLGARRVFQVTVAIHAVSMGMMAMAVNATSLFYAQALAGLAAAALVPSLVVLIAANYEGRQQAQALGVLAGVSAVAGALAFLVAGFLGTASSWRVSFGLLVFLAIAVLILSFRLPAVRTNSGVRFDFIGAILAAIAIALITLGVNNLNAWGVVLARPQAPFRLFGLSPAPFMVALGLFCAQAFLVWSRRRVERGKSPLLSLAVIDSRYERAALYCLLLVGALGPAVNFLIPLYIQIVQDRSSLFTAVAAVPYTLAIGASAVFVVSLYDRLTPRLIGIAGFVLVAGGLTLLAFTIRNDWSTPIVVLGLVLTGLGEGSLLTLMFNVLVALSPPNLAGQVGALRGVANNLSTALGTAFVSVIAVGVLSVMVTTALNRSTIPAELKAQVDLDNIDFVSNSRLKAVLAQTTATEAQVNEAVALNEEARLQALKASFMILAGVAGLAIFPAVGLPKITPPAMSGKRATEEPAAA